MLCAGPLQLVLRDGAASGRASRAKPVVVPSSMSKRKGRTQEGSYLTALSKKSRSAAFLVDEFDFAERDEKWRFTNAAQVLKMLAAEGRTRTRPMRFDSAHLGKPKDHWLLLCP